MGGKKSAGKSRNMQNATDIVNVGKAYVVHVKVFFCDVAKFKGAGVIFFDIF